MKRSPRTRKLGKKILQKQRNEEKNKFSRVKKLGVGDCCDAFQTDKVSEQLQSVIDKRNTLNEKNAQTQHERNTAADMDEAWADGDDDDEGGNSEDDHGDYDLIPCPILPLSITIDKTTLFINSWLIRL